MLKPFALSHKFASFHEPIVIRGKLFLAVGHVMLPNIMLRIQNVYKPETSNFPVVYAFLIWNILITVTIFIHKNYFDLIHLTNRSSHRSVLPKYYFTHVGVTKLDR